MTATSKLLERFTGALLEELGRWSARLVIAAVIGLASGFIVLPN
ncbi:hypothetical protein [Novosphingobium pentaromativorans]|uniref:Uncharacterized protein n=1 Tax=Novosphingobium pentaromativorans US6-1 TaxID=1088721 RepID=G6EKX6_9SPHN|nr:hypothetical protein [Novosphingobium pentaromativorans]EHJ57943.1 hypothetical protein NSU_pLA1049 [Novosphingobium pentaromativorans US6-1]